MSRSIWDHLADRSDRAQARLIGAMETVSLEAMPFDWRLMARPEQLAPQGDWRIWLVMAGRGFGKTRAGAEWVRAIAERDGSARIALVAASLHEARSVMVEGESGLLNIAPAWNRPIWNPALRRLVWKSGAQAMLFGAAEPESLRGPQFSHGWADELAKWPYAKAAWDNLMMGMRLGARPQLVATTTPRPTPLMRQLASDPQVRMSRGSSYDNAACLPQAFLDAMERDYGKTRLGRQELEGELIAELEGALWSHALLDACRCAPLSLDALEQRVERVVVAVDPPAGSEGDACGIIAAGIMRAGVGGSGMEGAGGEADGVGAGFRALVLADATVERMRPEGWARAVAHTAEKFGADRVVAEANNGGAMVESVLRAASLHLPVRLVHASRGKVARAEPVAALYEAGRVGHAGVFAELEEQLCGLTVGGGYAGPGRSPDRADALVWALSELMLKRPAMGSVRVL